MLRALKGTMIVKLDEKVVETDSGIICHDEERNYGSGKVKYATEVPDIKVGDYLLFDDCMKDRTFGYDGAEYIKIFPKEVICKLVDGKPVPILNKLVIKEAPDYDTTAGGIVIPDEYKNGSCFGEVKASGNGLIGLKGTRIPLTVLVGETVLFSQWKKLDIDIKGKKFTVIREDSIAVIIDNADLSERIERSKWRQ